MTDHTDQTSVLGWVAHYMQAGSADRTLISTFAKNLIDRGQLTPSDFTNMRGGTPDFAQLLRPTHISTIRQFSTLPAPILGMLAWQSEAAKDTRDPVTGSEIRSPRDLLVALAAKAVLYEAFVQLTT